MTKLDLETAVGVWVAHQPALARVFGKLGIDYCCQGQETFSKAFGDRGLDALTASRILQASEFGRSVDDHGNWQLASVGQLIEHIVAEHHGFVRAELPRLGQLLEHSDGNGVENPNASQGKALEAAYGSLRQQLLSTIEAEERELFAILKKLDSIGAEDTGTIKAVLTKLRGQHQTLQTLMHQLENLLDHFKVGESMTESYRAFVEGVKELSLDLHVHLHEEDYILFEKVDIMLQDSRQVHK